MKTFPGFALALLLPALAPWANAQLIDDVTPAVPPVSAAAPVAAPVTAPPAPPRTERYVVMLKAFSLVGHQLDAPVPRALQDYTVFTETRRVRGRTVYEIYLGYFDSRSDAERARRLLAERFPQAQVVDLNRPPDPEPPDAKPPDAQPPVTEVAEPVAPQASAPETAPVPVPAPSEPRAQLARLGEAAPRARVRPLVTPSTTLVGSVSQFYYGGQSKVRTQEFQDSPISGLPELQSDNTFSGTDQKQAVSSVDLNWRHRDAERDMRFVFRDSYTADLLDSRRTRNRLSALYFDHRSTSLGTNVRVGRQSGTGSGVLGRFDGVQGGYLVAPRWRVNAVAGQPTDKLLDSKRRFVGTSVDAEALTPELSGTLYVIQQAIDGEVDRRALGSELRYFSGGTSAFGMLDYDQVLKDINIAMVQATWQRADNTVVNLLFDRRATPMLSLGNALFFQTASPPAQSIRELLAGGATVGDLRTQVKSLNSYTTQSVLGVTTPVSARWQIGADIRSTQIGEIAPVANLLPYGQKPTKVLSLGTQFIGSNLYSARDTHVFGLSWLRGATQLVDVPDPVNPANSSFRNSTYTAVLLNYNNSSLVRDALTLEPSIKFYRQTDNAGLKTTRWTPGLRLSYRLAKQLATESELTSEYSKSTSPARNESSNRVYYYLGARYDF